MIRVEERVAERMRTTMMGMIISKRCGLGMIGPKEMVVYISRSQKLLPLLLQPEMDSKEHEERTMINNCNL